MHACVTSEVTLLCTVPTPLLLTPDVWVSHTKQFNPRCTLTGRPTAELSSDTDGPESAQTPYV